MFSCTNSGLGEVKRQSSYEIAVPSDARQIEIWFHNFLEIGGRCDAWDSRFGENYSFDAAGPNPIEE
jgi:hypothetical protein